VDRAVKHQTKGAFEHKCADENMQGCTFHHSQPVMKGMNNSTLSGIRTRLMRMER
jgi:hypothetical protein